jgi:hypothetical protein
MKPVLVQNLIQAAKKKRGNTSPLGVPATESVQDRRSLRKDRSGSIIVMVLIILFVAVIVIASVI